MKQLSPVSRAYAHRRWAPVAVDGFSIVLLTGVNSTREPSSQTAGAFAGLSLWGYTTKKDLSGMGSFLIMGVIGLIIASVVKTCSCSRARWRS